jgi:hypothetical protein
MDHREVDRRRKLIGSGLLALAKQGVIKTGGKNTGWVVAKCVQFSQQRMALSGSVADRSVAG